MIHTTLISAEELARVIDRCVVVDCRHDLMDVAAGRRAYDEGHIPGAHFLSVDADLSGPKTGRNGRHPLPERHAFRARLAQLGLSDDMQLVAYDASGGQFAGRLWWMARWIGHLAVAVLDGGIDAWRQAGYPLARETPATPAAGVLTERAPRVQAVDVEAITRNLGSDEWLVVDARSAERYAGKVEPLDPVAGHIPHAVNRPYQLNLRDDGRFKPAPVLRAEFDALLAGRAPDSIVHQCGSGVSALHNLLAMEYAGLEGSMLYPGSWSEWCSDPARPVATGVQP